MAGSLSEWRPSPYCIQLLYTTNTSQMDMAGSSSIWKCIYCTQLLYTTHIGRHTLSQNGGLSLLYTVATYNSYRERRASILIERSLSELYVAAVYSWEGASILIESLPSLYVVSSSCIQSWEASISHRELAISRCVVFSICVQLYTVVRGFHFDREPAISMWLVYSSCIQ